MQGCGEYVGVIPDISVFRNQCNAGMFKHLKFVKIEANQIDVCHSTGVPQGSELILLLTCSMHLIYKRPFFKFKKCHTNYKSFDAYSH